MFNSDKKDGFPLFEVTLATPKTLTDYGGQIAWKATHDPFDKATVQSSGPTLNIRFPGQYFDEETGFHYNWRRYYDPAIGRYITSDPIGLAGGINTYSYALNNPVSFIDPTGEWAQIPIIILRSLATSAVGGAIGGGVGGFITGGNVKSIMAGAAAGAMVGRAIIGSSIFKIFAGNVLASLYGQMAGNVFSGDCRDALGWQNYDIFMALGAGAGGLYGGGLGSILPAMGYYEMGVIGSGLSASTRISPHRNVVIAWLEGVGVGLGEMHLSAQSIKGYVDNVKNGAAKIKSKLNSYKEYLKSKIIKED